MEAPPPEPLPPKEPQTVYCQKCLNPIAVDQASFEGIKTQ